MAASSHRKKEEMKELAGLLLWNSPTTHEWFLLPAEEQGKTEKKDSNLTAAKSLYVDTWRVKNACVPLLF